MSTDFEHAYDTRAWSPGFEAVFARREADAAAYRAAALRERRAELGLRYGASERQIIDLFHPAPEATVEEIAVFIHGGYWRAQAPHVFSNLARGLNARGVTVALVGYDLCPQVALATIIDQIRAACLVLWRRYRRRLLVSGHSAGGHLTACMVATDFAALSAEAPADLVPAGYAISGVFELAPLVHTSLNADLRLDAETAEHLSPVFWPVAPGRQLDAVVGGAESPEFQRQSRMIVETWARAGAATRYEAVPDANHFTILAPLADPDSAMVDRLCALSRRVQGGAPAQNQ